MKVYQQLFNENLGAIKRIKELRQQRSELENQFKTAADDRWDISDQIGHVIDMENCEWAELIQWVDEAYYNQPFAHIRKQGKDKFYQMVNEYLAK